MDDDFWTLLVLFETPKAHDTQGLRPTTWTTFLLSLESGPKPLTAPGAAVLRRD